MMQLVRMKMVVRGRSRTGGGVERESSECFGE
jgi:hypothetical protein